MPGGHGALKQMLWSQYSPGVQLAESRQSRTGGGGEGGSLQAQISQPSAPRWKPYSQASAQAISGQSTRGRQLP